MIVKLVKKMIKGMLQFILLALFVFWGVVSFLPTKVSAKGTVQKDTTLDCTKFTSDQSDEDEGWSWIQSSSTLTLNGFNQVIAANPMDGLVGIEVPERSTIVLEGQNNIDLEASSVGCVGINSTGILTFKGTGEINISVKAGSAGNTYGIHAGSHLYFTENVMVNVRADARNMNNVVIGIESTGGNIKVSNSASLNVRAEGAMIHSKLSGNIGIMVRNTNCNFETSSKGSIYVNASDVGIYVFYGQLIIYEGKVEVYGETNTSNEAGYGAIYAGQGLGFRTGENPTINNCTTAPSTTISETKLYQTDGSKPLSFSYLVEITFDAHYGTFKNGSSTHVETAGTDGKVAVPTGSDLTFGDFVFDGWYKTCDSGNQYMGKLPDNHVVQESATYLARWKNSYGHDVVFESVDFITLSSRNYTDRLGYSWDSTNNTLTFSGFSMYNGGDYSNFYKNIGLILPANQEEIKIVLADGTNNYIVDEVSTDGRKIDGIQVHNSNVTFFGKGSLTIKTTGDGINVVANAGSKSSVTFNGGKYTIESGVNAIGLKGEESNNATLNIKDGTFALSGSNAAILDENGNEGNITIDAGCKLFTGTKYDVECFAGPKALVTEKGSTDPEKVVKSCKLSFHTCVYDKEIATDEHLKSAATCDSPAVYYKSCECGENGTETFTAGSKLSHVDADGDGKCDLCSKDMPKQDGNNGGTTKKHGNVFVTILIILLILLLLVVGAYVLWKYEILLKGEVCDKIFNVMDKAAVPCCKLVCKKEKLFTKYGTKNNQK